MIMSMVFWYVYWRPLLRETSIWSLSRLGFGPMELVPDPSFDSTKPW